MDLHENAVYGDDELCEALNNVNPTFGDFCIRVAAEAWGKPLISQKVKTLLAVALDVDGSIRRLETGE